jgi:hypothetical protein
LPQNGKKDSESKPPVVFIRGVKSQDLNKELKIHLDNLDHEMEMAADKYARWAGLLAEVSGRVAKLEEVMEKLQADLFIKYSEMLRSSKKGTRVTDIKYYIIRHSKYQRLHRRLRKWQDSERVLKYAERAFVQRKEMLQSLNANQRKEKE